MGMIIDKILGNIAEATFDKEVDYLDLEWHEANKRIYRKSSRNGRNIAVRFLSESVHLADGDVLVNEKEYLIVVNIVECETIVLQPTTMSEMASLCYEIGNKHMPIFLLDDKVVMPYETPMFKWVESMGYKPEVALQKLGKPLKSNVAPHSHTLTEQESSHSESLFTRVVKFASKVSDNSKE